MRLHLWLVTYAINAIRFTDVAPWEWSQLLAMPSLQTCVAWVARVARNDLAMQATVYATKATAATMRNCFHLLKALIQPEGTQPVWS